MASSKRSRNKQLGSWFDQVIAWGVIWVLVIQPLQGGVQQAWAQSSQGAPADQTLPRAPGDVAQSIVNEFELSPEAVVALKRPRGKTARGRLSYLQGKVKVGDRLVAQPQELKAGDRVSAEGNGRAMIVLRSTIARSGALGGGASKK